MSKLELFDRNFQVPPGTIYLQTIILKPKEKVSLGMT
jgi:hypothetical protein